MLRKVALATLLFCAGGVLLTPSRAAAQHHYGDHHHLGGYSLGHYHDHYYHDHHHHYVDYWYYRPYGSYYPLPSLSTYRSYYQAVPPLETVVGGNRCRVEVRVPVADAQVMVDGAKTTSLGLNRQFESPELKPGKEYSYRITASWKQGGDVIKDERVIQVKAGRTSLVDFTRPAAPEPLPAPMEPNQ